MTTSTTTPSLPAPEGSGKRSGKKLLIIALGTALLALGGLGAATQEGAANDEQAGEDRPAPVVLIDIPDVTTSITRQDGGRSSCGCGRTSKSAARKPPNGFNA